MDPRDGVAEAAAAYHQAVADADAYRTKLITAVGTAIDQGCAHADLASYASLSRQSITKYADAYRRTNAVAAEASPSLPREPTG